MTKAKDDKKLEAADVAVLLKCIYSGDGESANPGDIITVDAEEAERLVGLGVAEVVAAEAPATDDGTAA